MSDPRISKCSACSARYEDLTDGFVIVGGRERFHRDRDLERRLGESLPRASYEVALPNLDGLVLYEHFEFSAERFDESLKDWGRMVTSTALTSGITIDRFVARDNPRFDRLRWFFFTRSAAGRLLPGDVIPLSLITGAVSSAFHLHNMGAPVVYSFVDAALVVCATIRHNLEGRVLESPKRQPWGGER